jgi:hypothetical protein
MRLLIQLTFNKGIGNLYCNVIEILDFVTLYKNIGYKCDLIFSSNGENLKNKYINYIQLGDIFDLSLFDVFDSIRNFENSITDKEFEGFTYYKTQYGAEHPGIHSWDVYFNKPINSLPYHMRKSSMESFLSNIFKPKLVPKLNKKLYEKATDFINNNKNITKAIHIRYNDYIIHPENYFKEISKNLFTILKSTKINYHFMSNNQYIIDEVTKLPNIKKYNFKNLEILSNDHPYFHHYKNVDYDILLDRFYDNLTEMLILSYYDTIYYSTLVGPWISTFLYYSTINNPNQKLINIRENLKLITQ